MGKYRLRKKMCWDERGALEGLPLYLIILVVIAALAIVIILGIIGGIDSPKAFGTISSNPNQITLTDDDGDGFSSTETQSLTIIVRDTSKDKVKGATVTLSGSDVRFSSGGTAWAETNENGEAIFNNLHLEVDEGDTGKVTAKVTKTDYPDKSIEVPVIG